MKNIHLHIQFFSLAIILSLFTTQTSAIIFPNISSIPQDLLPNINKTAWSSFLSLTGCKHGQKVDGLSKLKNYFNYFGYISKLSNFTDDYDDVLESAVKTYQQNFNLNPTGELDLQTLQQIIKPRCGNADIVNGTTSMNAKTNNKTSSLHTVSHFSFFPGTPRWPPNRRDLTYGFHPGNQLSNEVKSVFIRAFDRWAKVIPMTFTETADFNDADMRIGFYVGDHGDGEPFDGVLGTLAHAFSPPNGRFHLDGDENWVVTGDASGAMGAVDLESVAVHEIGHLLGLGHSSVEDAIMYPTITSSTRRVELHSDDIQGVQFLYGSNPSYNGSATGNVPTGETGQTGMFDDTGAAGRNSFLGIGALVTVGFGLLIL